MAMDTGDFLLDDVGQWLGAFASPTVLIELASLLVCVGLAWVVVAGLQCPLLYVHIVLEKQE